MSIELWLTDKERGAAMCIEDIDNEIKRQEKEEIIPFEKPTNNDKQKQSNLCIDCGKACSGLRCITCHEKTFEFYVGRFKFKSKKELDLVIKQKIKKAEKNVKLYDELLLTVVNELHEEVKKRNYKVTCIKILDWDGQVGRWSFCRDRFRGGIFVIGFFEPIKEWHGVTLYPHKRNNNPKSSLILSLRQKWSESVKRRSSFVRCEICRNYNPQLHHDNISFNEIFNICYNFFSDKEKSEGVGDDWWLHEQEADAIPDEHPAVKKMLELHNKVKYRWLCSYCHKKEHSKLNKVENNDSI